MKKIFLYIMLSLYSCSAFAEGIVCVTKQGVFLFDTETEEYRKIAELGKLIPHQTAIFISSFSTDSVTFVLYNSHTPYPDQYPTLKNAYWEHFEYVFVYKRGQVKQTAMNRFYKEGGNIVFLQTNPNQTGMKRTLESGVISDRYSGNPFYNRDAINVEIFWCFNIRGTERDIDSNNCLQVQINDTTEKFFCGHARKSERHVFKKKITSYIMVDIRPQYDYALFAKKVASPNGKQVWEFVVSELDIKTKRKIMTWNRYHDMIYSFSGRYIMAKQNGRYRVIDRENGYSESLLRKDIVKAFWVG